MLRKFFFLTLITSIPLYGQQEKKKVDKKETEIKEVIVTATKTKKNLKNVPITVQVITSEDIKHRLRKDRYRQHRTDRNHKRSFLLALWL